MVIVETSVFTRQVQALLSEEYRLLQIQLVADPKLGKIMKWRFAEDTLVYREPGKTRRRPSHPLLVSVGGTDSDAVCLSQKRARRLDA